MTRTRVRIPYTSPHRVLSSGWQSACFARRRWPVRVRQDPPRGYGQDGEGTWFSARRSSVRSRLPLPRPRVAQPGRGPSPRRWEVLVRIQPRGPRSLRPSSSGKDPWSPARGHGFKSRRPLHTASKAQGDEHPPFKRSGAGSNPAGGTTDLPVKHPWRMRRSHKPEAPGSNPGAGTTMPAWRNLADAHGSDPCCCGFDSHRWYHSSPCPPEEARATARSIGSPCAKAGRRGLQILAAGFDSQGFRHLP